jgi:hypothetical protein
MTASRRLPAVAAVLLLAAVVAAYLPYVGAGFKQDDFGWIASSRVRHAADWIALLGRNTGFYRPAVAATFAADELAFGMQPFGYGLTNLALALGCLGAIAGLGRSLGLARGAALAAGAVWALNFQGVNMAIVWTSGRTALLLVLFASLAARASVGRNTAAAVLFTLLAMLSKEEAVVLPVLLFVWSALADERDRGSGIGSEGAPRFALRAALKQTWPLVLPLAVYVLLRAFSGAFGPLSAPVYYRLTLAPLTVLDNAAKYLDFAATWPTLVVLLASVVAAVVPRPARPQARVVLLGVIWLGGGYAITLFLPVRSPLYACFPAVGTSLAAAALLEAAWSRSTARGRTRLVATGLVLPFVLLPVYWSRNVRHAKGAELSARWLNDLQAAHLELAPDQVLVLQDDPRLHPTERLPAAFGTLYDVALRDTFGHPVRAWIEPPPDGWEMAGIQPPDPAAPRVVFALRGGHLVRVSPRTSR